MQELDGRVRNLEAESLKTAEEIKTLEKRVTNHGVEITELQIKTATMNTILERIDATVSKINGKLDAQTMKPAQRWEDLVKQVTALLVAAIIGGIIIRLGIGA